jgi:hypothetical protein
MRGDGGGEKDKKSRYFLGAAFFLIMVYEL